MAKKAKIETKTINAGNNEFTIGTESKSANYVYDSNLSGTIDVTFNRTPKDTTEAINGLSAVYKNKNDLVVVQKIYGDGKTIAHTVKSTVKNFYTDSKSNDIIIDSEFQNWTFTKSTEAGNVNGFYAQAKNDSTYTYIMGTTKSNKYTLNTKANSYLWDEKGNDKYTASNGIQTAIRDFAGKDNYIAKGNAKIISNEYSGNDKYNINEGALTANEYAGNDKYTLLTAKKSIINDSKGKDKYTIIASNDIAIKDSEGADKYSFSNIGSTRTSGVDVVDEKGNDKYTFSRVGGNDQAFIVNDYTGADNYTFKKYNSDNGIVVVDGTTTDSAVSGNDKYTFSGTAGVSVDDGGGKNTYTVKNSDSIEIVSSSVDMDTNMNDKYTVSGTKKAYCTDITISDLSATSNDKYSLTYAGNSTKGSADIIITDKGGSDTFSLKNTYRTSIYTSSNNTTDINKFNLTSSKEFLVYAEDVSNDIYNIKASKGNIIDEGGDDTYKVSKLKDRISLWDRENGTNDKLIIDSKAKNLVFMADFNNLAGDHSLYIYDKANKGFINLHYFFKDTENRDNSVEHIYAQKEKAKNDITAKADITFFNSIKESVASWVGDKSIDTILSNTNDPTAIATLVKNFEDAYKGYLAK